MSQLVKHSKHLNQKLFKNTIKEKSIFRFEKETTSHFQLEQCCECENVMYRIRAKNIYELHHDKFHFYYLANYINPF